MIAIDAPRAVLAESTVGKSAPAFMKASPDLVRRVVQCGALSLLVFELPERPADARDSYGSVLWPAATFLAHKLASEDLSGAAVLELGCGNGLCSLAALTRGAARVVASDYRELPLTLVEAAAREQPVAIDASRLEVRVLDMAAPMPGAAVVASRSRARRIPPCDAPLPPHDLLLAADVGYDEGLAWRLGERCRESLGRGGRVLVAESRQMPHCRRAFSEALNVGRPESLPRLQLQPQEWPVELQLQPSSDAAASSRVRVAAGGDEQTSSTIWLLDAGGAESEW